VAPLQRSKKTETPNRTSFSSKSKSKYKIAAMTTTAVTLACMICYDDLEQDFIYSCPTYECKYKICTPCIKRSFQDASGQSFKNCPECKVSMARNLLESIVGKGAINEVEEELRAKIEFDVQSQAKKREMKIEDMKQHKTKAVALFNKLSEQLNMKCPRCKQVFFDYDGCNALRCGNSECRAAFCAVCLIDCKDDAHSHINQAHGNVFDKNAFESARKEREAVTVKTFFEDVMKNEPFEVAQMVKNMHNKSQPSSDTTSAFDSRRKAEKFVDEARRQLMNAVRKDRLGLLQDASDDLYRRRGLRSEDISPRSMIPKEYKLEIVPSHHDHVYQVQLWKQVGFDILTGDVRWQREDLDGESKDKVNVDKERQVDALFNVVQSLKCGVIAFEGGRELVQTKFVPAPIDSGRLSDEQVSICFQSVSNNGDVEPDDRTFQVPGNGRIIGINPNQRKFDQDRGFN
jgi:phosphoribosyl-ATP pyrophosphohydrolase